MKSIRLRTLMAGLLGLISQMILIPQSSAATVYLDALNGNTCLNSFQPPSQWAHRFISGGGTITEISMLISGSTTYWNTSKIQIRGDSGSLPSSVVATFDATSISGNLVTYTGSFTTSANNVFWVNPYSAANPLMWCYFQAGGGTTTVSNGWSFDPNNNSGSKVLANTSDYTTWYSGSGGFQIQYRFQTGGASDVTAPTFSAPNTYSIPENSTNIGNIVVNESSTMSIDSGEDKLRFSLTRINETSSVLSFVSAPNFEAPADVGSNNSYIVVLRAVDAANNAKLETFTVTVTDVVETTSLSSFSLAGNAAIASYRTPITITAVATTPSRITFRWNGKVIAGCKSRPTTGSAPTATATCTWKPSLHGTIVLTAVTVPNEAGYSGTSAQLMVGVVSRTNRR